MTLQEDFERAILRNFKKQSRLISAHNKRVFKKVLEFQDTYGPAAMGNVQDKIESPELFTILTAEVEKRKKTLAKQLKGKELSIEFLFDHNKGHLLATPIRVDPQNELEDHLHKHVSAAYASVDNSVVLADFNGFLALNGYKKEVAGLEEALANVTEPLALANTEILLPKALKLSIQNEEHSSIDIKLNPTSIKYKLIPLRKAYAEFFPGYKEPFTISYKGNTFSAHVTSKNPQQKTGNYICSTNNGGMGEMLSALRCTPDTVLKVVALKPYEHYLIGKYRKPHTRKK